MSRNYHECDIIIISDLFCPTFPVSGDGGGLAVRGGWQRVSHEREAAQHHELLGGKPLRSGHQPLHEEQWQFQTLLLCHQRLQDETHGRRLLCPAHHRHQVHQALRPGQQLSSFVCSLCCFCLNLSTTTAFSQHPGNITNMNRCVFRLFVRSVGLHQWRLTLTAWHPRRWSVCPVSHWLMCCSVLTDRWCFDSHNVGSCAARKLICKNK